MNLVKSARQKRGLTQAALANLLTPAVAASYISQIESGYKLNPSPHVLRQLEEILDIKLIQKTGEVSRDTSDWTVQEWSIAVEAIRKARGMDPLERLKAGILVYRDDPGVDEEIMNAFALDKAQAMRVCVWKVGSPLNTGARFGWIIRSRAKKTVDLWQWDDETEVRSHLEWYRKLPGLECPVGLDFNQWQLNNVKWYVDPAEEAEFDDGEE